MDFNTDYIDTDVLINYVEKHPELYDKRNKKYRNSKHKNLLWSNISRQMGVKNLETKKKWTYLRDKFQREWKKKHMSGGKYVPSWSYFQTLKFLKYYVRVCGGEDNYRSTMTPTSSDFPAFEEISTKRESDYDEEDDGSVSQQCTNFSSSSTSNVKQSIENSKITRILELIERKSENDSQNHIHQFCLLVEHYLSELPKHVQDEAIVYIINYLVGKNKEFFT